MQCLRFLQTMSVLDLPLASRWGKKPFKGILFDGRQVIERMFKKNKSYEANLGRLFNNSVVDKRSWGAGSHSWPFPFFLLDRPLSGCTSDRWKQTADSPSRSSTTSDKDANDNEATNCDDPTMPSEQSREPLPGRHRRQWIEFFGWSEVDDLGFVHVVLYNF